MTPERTDDTSPPLSSPPFGSYSQSSYFEDARSDSFDVIPKLCTLQKPREELTRELDSLLDSIELHSESTSTSNHSNLSPSELEFSKRIRRKYGVKECSPSPSLSSHTTELAHPSYRTGGRGGGDLGHRNPPEEVAIIFSTMQSIARRFLEEELSGEGVENEHALLEPFLAVLEIALHHGWRGTAEPTIFGRKISVWEFIKRLSKWTKSVASQAVIENVRQFSTLRTSAAKVRAWIRLAIMNKSFSPDLALLNSNENALLVNCYEEWSCLRSDSFEPLLALISSLDGVDFNLFVKEDDMAKTDFVDNWGRLFAADRINFDQLDPPVHISLGLINPPRPTVSPFAAQPNGKDSPEDMLLLRLATLNEENARLRKSLVAQINKRAYFEDEYSKGQRRCAAMLKEQHELQMHKTASLQKIRDLTHLVEAHEHTNQSLQDQLAAAHADEPGDGAASSIQMHRMRETINQLGAQLEAEREARKGAEERLGRVEEEKCKIVETKEKQLQDLKNHLLESEDLWNDRTKVLREQLKLANSLKEEYKKRLKTSSPKK